MKVIKKLKWALPLALVMVLATTIIAFAITIAVDGNREAAWDGSGGQTPGTVTEGNEPGINDNVDIQIFQWTNDQTNFYFLVGVHAPPPLMTDLAPINICLNTDNSDTTDIPATNAIQRNRCSYDTGVTGIDTVVEAFRIEGAGDFARVFDVTQDPRVLIGNGTLGYNPAASAPVVEISVPLGLLGFGSGNCPATVPAVVFFDGGDGNPDDNLPSSGSVPINCGGPTAITLSNIGAQTNTAIVIAAAAVMMLLISGGAILVYKRSRV